MTWVKFERIFRSTDLAFGILRPKETMNVALNVLPDCATAISQELAIAFSESSD